MAHDKRQIVIHSGSGYHYRGHSGFVFDQWIMALTGKTRPTVCLVTAPQGDRDNELAAAFKHLGPFCDLKWAPIFTMLPPTQDPVDNLLNSDLIYIIGGFAQACVGAFKEIGFDSHLRTAHNNGVVIAGMCGGGMILSDAYANRWLDRPGVGRGLGLLDCAFTAHAQNKLYEPVGSIFRHSVRDKIMGQGASGAFQLQDGVGLRFQGTELVEAITTEPETALGWHLEAIETEDGPGLIETELQTESLERRLRIKDVEVGSDEFKALIRAMDVKERHRLLLRPLDSDQNPQEDGSERITQSFRTPDTDDEITDLPDAPGVAEENSPLNG